MGGGPEEGPSYRDKPGSSVASWAHYPSSVEVDSKRPYPMSLNKCYYSETAIVGQVQAIAKL